MLWRPSKIVSNHWISPNQYTAEISSINENSQHHESNWKVNNSKLIRCDIIVFLVITLILRIGRITNINLVRAIELKTLREITNNNADYSLLVNLTKQKLYKPCHWGCFLTEPLISNGDMQKERIVNGKRSLFQSCPWQMFFLVVDYNKRPRLFSGATLITNRSFLTIVHCVHHDFIPYTYISVRRSICLKTVNEFEDQMQARMFDVCLYSKSLGSARA